MSFGEFMHDSYDLFFSLFIKNSIMNTLKPASFRAYKKILFCWLVTRVTASYQYVHLLVSSWYTYFQ